MFSGLLVVLMVASVNYSGAQNKKGKYACDEPDPASLCNAGNTCGTAANPCSVDIRKSGSSASITPSVPGAKSNKVFCVHEGTGVTFMSSQKNTGFTVDFGPSAPHGDDNAIIGGANKPVTIVAKQQGCYKFAAGACISGVIYGMCGSSTSEAIVLPK